MRLRHVYLRNYRGVAECEIEFAASGVTIIEGQNEAGKTSIAEALQLAISLPDTSRNSRVTSTKPVDRDEGPEVEVALSSGGYDLVYRKRWLRQPFTTLEVSAPNGESLTGREAHDRLGEILAETLDEDLWRALRVDQGTELELPKFDIPSLGMALDRAAGGELAADSEDTLWGHINREYERYWTPTGLPRVELRNLDKGLDEARSEVGDLSKRLDGIESDAAEMSRLVADTARLGETLEERTRHESELSERWESAERLDAEVDRIATIHRTAESERGLAAREQHRRRELIDRSAALGKSLTNLEAEARNTAPVLSEATRQQERASVELEAASRALRSAESDYRRAQEDRDYRRRQIELEQLGERYSGYLRAAETLRGVEEFLESAAVDDQLVGQIEEAHIEHERAKAASDIGAASVEATALSDIALKVDGEEVELTAKEVLRTIVDDSTVLVVPGLVTIHVRAGAESKGLSDRRTGTAETLRALCEKGGVADLEEARKVAQRRRELERDREEASESIRRDLRDLTPEILLDKIEGLSRRVDSYPGERPEGTDLPPDFDEAKRVVEGMERLLDERRSAHQESDAAAKRATGAFHQAQVDERVLAEKIKAARNNRDDAAAELASAREKRTDEDLTADLTLAHEKVKQALGCLEKAQTKLKEADPDSVQELLENARDATKRAREQLQSNDEARLELRGSLAVRGEEGIHERYDEAVGRLRSIEREHERTRARAEAASLLRKTFAKYRQRARQRYVEPFKGRIDQLGRIVFGPTFSVEVDDDLRVARRTLNGTTLDISQLSTGAREQLGVLCRLACAAIVSPGDGGAPVVIDDALGWSDPQRLQSMGAAIASAGRSCQVIVLTCTPGRYANVGKARVVTVGS